MVIKARLDKLEAKLNAIPNTNNEAIEKTKSDSYRIQTGLLKDQPVLEQNEPNPFTEKTEIRYFLPVGTINASIKVKNNEGAIVGDFALSNSGNGSVIINPGTLLAGIYHYSLIVNNSIIDTKKMTLLK